MGDHSKTGINTMVNTGTVVGIAANIFGTGFPPKFVPSFSWGDKGEIFDIHKLDKMATNWMKSKGKTYNDTERNILHHIYNNEIR